MERQPAYNYQNPKTPNTNDFPDLPPICKEFAGAMWSDYEPGREDRADRGEDSEYVSRALLTK
jgi:hypothetical protein